MLGFSKIKLMILGVFGLFLVWTLPAHAQTQVIQDFLLHQIEIGVRADMTTIEMSAVVHEFNVTVPGYYRILPRVLYNSGDEQRNESFFITVDGEDTSDRTPVDPNIGPYRIVYDDPGPRHIAWRDCGLFYFNSGKNTVKMHHVSTIMNEYPLVLSGPINGPESVKIVDSLRVVAEPFVDGALQLNATAPHLGTINGGTHQYAEPGDEIDYQIIIQNNYINTIRNYGVESTLPDKVMPGSFSIDPDSISNRTVYWFFKTEADWLEPTQTKTITFKGRLDLEMLPGQHALINTTHISVPHDIDDRNDQSEVMVYSVADSNGHKNEFSDVDLFLISDTDTTIQIGGVEKNATLPDGSINYVIRLQNIAADPARNIRLVSDISPDFIYQLSSTAPAEIVDNKLSWEIDSLQAMETVNITVIGRAADEIPPGNPFILNTTTVTAENDTNLLNNVKTDTIHIVQPALPAKYDIALNAIITTEYQKNVGGTLVPAIYPGQEYQIDIIVTNNGPVLADSVTFFAAFPDSIRKLTFTDSNIKHWTGSQFEYQWSIGQLAPTESWQTKITVLGREAYSLMPWLLENGFWALAPHDSTENNNHVDSAVYVFSERELKNLTDIQVDQQMWTDSTALVGADTLYFLQPGETFAYKIDVQNLTVVPAQNVVVKNGLPAYCHIFNSIPAPQTATADSLIWVIPELAANSSQQFTVQAILDPNAPKDFILTQNTALVSADNEPIEDQGDNFTQVDLHIVPKEDPPMFGDISLQMSATADSAYFKNGALVPVAKPGETVTYELLIMNSGPDTARFVEITSTLFPLMALTNVSPLPETISPNNLFWELGIIEPGVTRKIEFSVQLPDQMNMSDSLFVLSGLAASANDSSFANNMDSAFLEVYIKPLPPKPRMIDLEVTGTLTTDSLSVANGDTLNFTRPGKSYEIELKLKNNGPETADSIEVFLTIPPEIESILPELAHTTQNSDTLFWSVDSIPANAIWRNRLQIRVSEDDGAFPTELWHQLNASAPRDSTPNVPIDLLAILLGPQLIDLGVTASLTTDSIMVINNDTLKFTEPGKSYEIELKLNNYGPDTAEDIELFMTVPAEIKSIIPELNKTRQNADTLFWSVDSIPANATWRNRLLLQVSEDVSNFPIELWHSVNATAPLDGTPNTPIDLLAFLVEHYEPVIPTDLAIYQTVYTDSSVVTGTDTTHYAQENEQYQYTLRLVNNTEVTAHNVRVTDAFPQHVTLHDFSVAPKLTFSDSLVWKVDSLAGYEQFVVTFEAHVPGTMPIGLNELQNQVWGRATNENPATMDDNYSVSRVYNNIEFIPLGIPEITATPSRVDVTEEINIRVQLPQTAVAWDLRVLLPYSEVDSTFGDNFISNTGTVTEQWLDVDETYLPEHLITQAEEERIAFEVQAWDRYGNQTSSRADVLIQSSDYFVLDRNVFTPASDTPLEIQFKLSNQRLAKLDVYDVSGRHIAKLADREFQGGWTTFTWDGRDNDGRLAGSGVYIITLRSGDFKSWKKLIIVR